MGRMHTSKRNKVFVKPRYSRHSYTTSSVSEYNSKFFDQKRLESDSIYCQILNLIEIIEILYDCDPENQYLFTYKKELTVLFAKLLNKYKISRKDFDRLVPVASKLLNKYQLEEIQDQN